MNVIVAANTTTDINEIPPPSTTTTTTQTTPPTTTTTTLSPTISAGYRNSPPFGILVSGARFTPGGAVTLTAQNATNGQSNTATVTANSSGSFPDYVFQVIIPNNTTLYLITARDNATEITAPSQTVAVPGTNP
jgi:hypothetical protein